MNYRTTLALALLVSLCILLLGGCSGSPEEYKEKQKSFSKQAALEGCTFQYIGDYPRKTVADIPIVLVKCEGKTTTTANTIIPQGKSRVPMVTVTISEIEAQIQELDQKRTALNKLTDEDKAALGLK